MLLVCSINPSAPTLFLGLLSSHTKSYNPPKTSPGKHGLTSSTSSANGVLDKYNTSPAKLMWALTPHIHAGIWFVETRLSDLICQHDCQALEFKGYEKNFITRHGFSPDAFMQTAFQAPYFGLYAYERLAAGRTECTYEPAMTKSFLHWQTETIRTIQPESVDFTKTFFSEAPNEQRIATLRRHAFIMWP
ncbi:Choline/Carnitine o-acyltransferase-domain-containing protein [Chiua virens]|nr:Choline/Carnitine o-acyltransferase-domain-containing protein [Chiua virens]